MPAMASPSALLFSPPQHIQQQITEFPRRELRTGIQGKDELLRMGHILIHRQRPCLH